MTLISLKDDFTVTDPNGWYIDEITFFAYQTGSPLTSTMTAVNYRIWDGPPDDSGSSIVFGQSMPNRLVDTQWSGIYRVSETSLDSVIRPIMQNTTSGGTVLGPGTYWLEWQTDGDPLLSGPWLPPVTISGVVTTGNALQNFNGAWGSVLDGGTAAPQDLPFIISGYALTDIPWATAEPVSGTLSSGTTDVTVTFDSTGLSNGIYTGTLLVANNDPDTPLIPVPITLTVDFLHTYLPFVTKN